MGGEGAELGHRGGRGWGLFTLSIPGALSLVYLVAGEIGVVEMAGMGNSLPTDEVELGNHYRYGWRDQGVVVWKGKQQSLLVEKVELGICCPLLWYAHGNGDEEGGGLDATKARSEGGELACG